MPLAGARLGPYELLSPIGSGGRGRSREGLFRDRVAPEAGPVTGEQWLKGAPRCCQALFTTRRESIHFVTAVLSSHAAWLARRFPVDA
jgi:hypothetical protein